MYDPRKIVSYGFPLDAFTFTYKLPITITQLDLGKAVTLDVTAACAMKLSVDGSPINGRLFSIENRTNQGAGYTGAVQRRFKEKLPAAIGHPIVVGDSVCGSAVPGEVRKIATEPKTNLVVEIGTDFVVVESF